MRVEHDSISSNRIDRFGALPPSNGSRIGYLCPEGWRIVKKLRLFYEIGSEFRRGAKSLRDVADKLERRDLRREYPSDLGYALSSVQRASNAVEEFFGMQQFRLGHKAPLLNRRGKGMPAEGLTELGWNAWRLTAEWLVLQGIVQEDA